MNGSIWDDIKLRIINSGNSLIHIIAINVVAFLAMAIPLGIMSLWTPFDQLYGSFSDWMFLPGDLSKLVSRPWTLVTHFFLHSFGIGHILFNMLWLFWFGRIYHSLMGNKKTVELYLLAGLIGGLAFIVAANTLPTLSVNSNLVGASGAVTGFIIAAATLAPHFTIRLFFFGDIKIWYIAAFSIITDLIFISGNIGGITAHLAGGLTGYLYVTQLKKGRNLGGWISSVLEFFQLAFKPKPKSSFKVHQNTNARSNTSSSTNSASQAEIDAILEKIHKSGYESLSAREKEVLFRASDRT